MNTYESIIILTAKATEEEIENFKNQVAELISSNGEMIGVDDWGIKKLAYDINHEKEGHYYLYNFKSDPSLILEFERVLRINDKVLKQMVIKK
jgi:small subunit ribosomal protein S6